MSAIERLLEKKKDNPFLTIILTEELERLKRLKRFVPIPTIEIPKPKLRVPHITPFREPLQDKIIEPGKTDTVYRYEIPYGQVGYIQQIGNNSFEDAHLIWMVDDIQVIKGPITWDIANINSPKLVTPWLPAYKLIQWIGFNESDKRCHFQVLTDGFLVGKGQVSTLLDMKLPLGEL